MPTINLKSNELSAAISTEGGWVESFSRDTKTIFYPKYAPEVDGKVKLRGGCHVCLPNFGPGGASGQPQHGYGRELKWKVEEESATSVLLSLEHGTGVFELLSSRLRYELTPDSLSMGLAVENKGREAVMLSPGFHPYFTTGDATTATIEDRAYDLSMLSEAQFLKGSSMRLRIAEAAYDLEATDLAIWALWSDRLADYVCLEPTADGFGFVDGTAGYIQPGQTVESSFSIRLAN